MNRLYEKFYIIDVKYSLFVRRFCGDSILEKDLMACSE